MKIFRKGQNCSLSRTIFSLPFLVAALIAGVMLQAQCAMAHEDQDRAEIMVQAPIDALNCSGTPATITVLGLTIDISKATFGDEGEHDGPASTCVDLKVGRFVRVALASDTPDTATGLLTAVRVESRGRECPGDGGWEDGVRVSAPIQAVDPGGASVTVLGLVVDITQAVLQDNDGDPIQASQLTPGLLARLKLVSSQPPLAASMVQVHTYEIKVEAPVDAVNCAGAPATLTMLGLSIDISNAIFEGHEGENEDDWSHPSCADISIGQTLKVKLASDVPDPTTKLLTATRVEMEGENGDEGESEVKVTAPLQSIDSTGASIKVLGLSVDISKAVLEDENGLPITAAQLSPGQFVELELVSSQAPLVATKLEAEPPVSIVNVQLLDEKGKPVNDATADTVQAAVAVKKGKKSQTIHVASNGSFRLAGLPAGIAKIAVVRTFNGKTSKAKSQVKVTANKTQNLTIRLKATRK